MASGEPWQTSKDDTPIERASKIYFWFLKLTRDPSKSLEEASYTSKVRAEQFSKWSIIEVLKTLKEPELKPYSEKQIDYWEEVYSIINIDFNAYHLSSEEIETYLKYVSV